MASSSAIPEAIVVSTMAILSDKLLAFEKEQGWHTNIRRW